jgi:hypothetical protein
MLPKQDNLPLARQMAFGNLLRSDLAERAARSGGRFEPEPRGEGKIRLPYLGREICLSFPGGTMEPRNGGDPLSLREEILIFHYLEGATGIPASGEWTSFSEIPGGTFYNPVFLQRCKAPLVKHFGEDPQKLIAVAAEEVRGETFPLGDTGVKVPAFPRVNLGLVLWKGDEEFPPEGNVLFDSSVTGYLPVEDIVILAETVVWKLIKKKNTFSPQRSQSRQS